jgi:hypothetical protein
VKTYVVRLAEPPGPDHEGPWPVRGVVDEIATGRRTPFRDSAELIAVLDGSEPDDRTER